MTACRWRCAEGAREMGYGGRMSERNQRVDGGAPSPVMDEAAQ
ncbi:hypothetical protein AB0C15_06890 [Micromonospora sp. NPDC048835]